MYYNCLIATWTQFAIQTTRHAHSFVTKCGCRNSTRLVQPKTKALGYKSWQHSKNLISNIPWYISWQQPVTQIFNVTSSYHIFISRQGFYSNNITYFLPIFHLSIFINTFTIIITTSKNIHTAVKCFWIN